MALAEYKTYHGHQVLRLNISNEEQLSKLRLLEELTQIDLWDDNFHLGQMDVRVPHEFKHSFEKNFLRKLHVTSQVLIPDLQQKIDEELSSMKNKVVIEQYNKTNAFQFFDSYRRLGEINNWMTQMSQNYAGHVSLITDFPSQSYERRQITGLKIGKKPHGSKPVILLHGGIHAREWISPTTVAWIAHELMSKYSSDPVVKKLVDDFEWHIFPVLNVDGYEFTHTNDRMWRKTRRPNAGSSCIGTDPNRNWAFKWNTGGSSSNPCSETFHGPAPFSEPEVKGMADYGKRLLPRLKGYIDYHAYGQLFMRPWGWSRDAPADERRLQSIGDSAAAAISRVRGRTYRSGRRSIIIYVASGSSADYF
jgi:carboxypeptidase A1